MFTVLAIDDLRAAEVVHGSHIGTLLSIQRLLRKGRPSTTVLRSPPCAPRRASRTRTGSAARVILADASAFRSREASAIHHTGPAHAGDGLAGLVLAYIAPARVAWIRRRSLGV